MQLAAHETGMTQHKQMKRTLGACCTHCLTCVQKRMNLYLKPDPSFPCSIYYKKQIRTLQADALKSGCESVHYK